MVRSNLSPYSQEKINGIYFKANYQRNHSDWLPQHVGRRIPTVKASGKPQDERSSQIDPTPQRRCCDAGMVQGNCSKQILDASWGTWLRMLVFKAEEAGRRIVAVDPRFTSQTCPCCGYKDAKNRPTQAEFKCLDCGFEANADFVASVNISARMEPLGVNVGRLVHA